MKSIKLLLFCLITTASINAFAQNDDVMINKINQLEQQLRELKSLKILQAERDIKEQLVLLRLVKKISVVA